MVRFSVRQTAPDGSDASDGNPEDVMEQRSEENRRQWTMARQPAHTRYRSCREWRGRRNHSEHCRARLEANAETLFPYPNGSQAEGPRSDRATSGAPKSG